MVVHSDRKIYLIEKLDSKYTVEDQLNAYATLVHTPTNVHTYRLDEFSLWSAALQGDTAKDITQFLQQYARNVLPQRIIEYIEETIRDFWTMEIYVEEKIFELEGNSKAIKKIVDIQGLKDKIVRTEETTVTFDKKDLYTIRNILLNENLYLVEKNTKSTSCNLKIKDNITLYRYQREAVEAFMNKENQNITGRGVMIMPPGSGKTIVGLKVIELLKVNTLILVKTKDDYKIWLNEIKDKTNFDEEHIAYNDFKLEKPICVCTYDYVAKVLDDEMINVNWGFIIYDNANSLPTTKRSRAAYIPSKYKLAMDSILWRSDNNEGLIFKTIGPKVFNVTLKKLEEEHYQIKVKCFEVKIPFKPWDIEDEEDINHTVSKNLNKVEAFGYIENKHKDKQKILVSRFKKVAGKFHEAFTISLCDGGSNDQLREEMVGAFNDKDIDSIVFTNIFESQSLKDIDVLISLSYYGESEREEYLRIGKLKGSNEGRRITGYYYALVSEDTKEEEIYIERRDNMLKYGYDFRIITLEELRRGDFEV